MNHKYTVIVILYLMLGTGLALADTPSAEQVVKTTADQVIARLKAEREQLDARPELIYDLVNEMIIPHFDFHSMSKWVLGLNWRQATEDQRQQFTAEFRTLLVRTYAKTLLEYSDNEISYLPVQNDPGSNLVQVKTEIQQDGTSKIPINYSMHISGGEWKVVDVTIDGISLVSTYRGSFAAEIRNNGIEMLITKLVNKNTNIVNSKVTSSDTTGNETN